MRHALRQEKASEHLFFIRSGLNKATVLNGTVCETVTVCDSPQAQTKSKENKYVQKILFNNTSQKSLTISYDQIQANSELTIVMGSKPNK